MNYYIISIKYRAYDRDHTTPDFLSKDVPPKEKARRYVRTLSGCPTAYLLSMEAHQVLQTKFIDKVEYKNDWIHSEENKGGKEM